ncbi:EP300-interacting inhibitor of differentiation 3-like [Daphnia pulicaria]|uniref:EP300-interacting inhibitor of differentiation 3-like n=1 Tax=Daphnia pulicaria TaxID=35523 RepID=UPI001EEBDC21|nr:EP300-interacting inhibitor of differentiation 3-like [Daphnia pulicaria]
MAAEADGQEQIGEADTDARMQIQDIIESLNVEELNLTEPGNKSLDRKITQLDRIFDEYDGKNVNASQARLDIVAFSKLAAINHQRIRRVAASSWNFRATDFANRIVRLVDGDESRQSESQSEDKIKKKLDQMVQPRFNRCVPLKPLLGAVVLHKHEAVPKERRQRQPRNPQEKVVAQLLQPKKLDDIAEEDQNTAVAKHVEYIMKCLAKEYKANNEKPISFYHFVIDPTSFSNSVENIFYISFLIKDGHVSINEDGENGLPSLRVVPKKTSSSQAQEAVSKKQLVLSLDQRRWQAISQGLGLKSAAIDPKSKKSSFHKRPRHN